MAISAAAGKKETQFLWEGKDKRGNKVRGKSLAANEAALRADLRRQGVAATRIKTPSAMFKSGGKISAMDIAVFARQLATMMSAGIPMVQAFEIIGNGHEKPAMQKLVLDVKATIEGGSTLHESLAKHPLYFDDLFVNLVEAGEQAGALETLLDKIATYKEKTESLKKKIKKALFYPTAVLVVAIIVTVILLIFVIPQFESVFAGMLEGAQLPAFTRLVLGISEVIKDHILIALGVGIVLWIAFVLFIRTNVGRRVFDKVKLKAPVIGPVVTKVAISRFTRTLGTLVSSGVPILQALTIVKETAGNVVISNSFIKKNC